MYFVCVNVLSPHPPPFEKKKKLEYLSGNNDDVSKNVNYISNGSYFLVTSVIEMPFDSPASVAHVDL